MIQGVQISVTATAEQIELMETQCEVMEGMMAHTLARRIEGKKPEGAILFIRDWFKTVRQFAQGSFMASGIRSYCKPIFLPGEAPQPEPPPAPMNGLVGSPDILWARENHNDLVNLLEQARALCAAIERLPACEHQTSLSLKASDLSGALQSYLYKAP